MAKALKHMLASQLEADLKDSTSGLLLVDPGGMTVASAMAFRRDLRENAGGATLRIIHNRTARVALTNLDYSGETGSLTESLSGPSAVIYGGDGPISIAKIVRDWRKKEKQLKVKGAVADGEILSADDAAMLADMPDLEQLKGMLAGLLVSSARGIAGSLQAVFGGIARALQARIDSGALGVEETPAEEAAPAEEAPAEEAPAQEAPAEEAPAEEPPPEEGKGDE